MTIECQLDIVFCMAEEDPEEMASKHRQHGNAANNQGGKKLVDRQRSRFKGSEAEVGLTHDREAGVKYRGFQR